MSMAWTRRAFALGFLSFVVFLQACASGPPPTPTQLGEAALAAGDWRSAQTHFAQALDLDEANGRAWFGQAKAQLAGRDPESALRSLAALARVDRTLFNEDAQPCYADTLESVTQHRLERNQPEAALAAARALAKADPSRRSLPRLLGQSLFAEGDRRRLIGERDQALALFMEANRVSPQFLEGWVAAAELMIEARKGREAVRLLEEARQYHPSAGALRTLTVQALHAR